MFKIAATPTYSATVKVDFILEDGKTETRSFKAKFKRLEQSELDTISEGAREGSMTDSEIVDRVLVGWDGVADEHGNPLEFNPENLKALLNLHPTRPSIVRTFYATIGGSKAKN